MRVATEDLVWFGLILLVSLTMLGVAAGILVQDRHSGQARPRIAHLFQKDNMTASAMAATDNQTPRQTTATTSARRDCAPENRPPAWEIRRDARARAAAVWLMVHEGDANAMTAALLAGIRDAGGHAIRNRGSLFTGENPSVTALAPKTWLQRELDPMSPYADRPQTDTEPVTAGYEAWAGKQAAATRKIPPPCRPNDRMLPVNISVAEKPVGDVRDRNVKMHAWTLLAAGLVIGGAGIGEGLRHRK